MRRPVPTKTPRSRFCLPVEIGIPPEYQWDTAALLHGIWKQETVELQGQRFIVAGSWARGDGTRGIDESVMATSSFAPYAYRIFAEFDPSRPWLDLVDSTYRVLSAITQLAILRWTVGLIPTYFKLDAATATPRLAGAIIAGADGFRSTRPRSSRA